MYVKGEGFGQNKEIAREEFSLKQKYQYYWSLILQILKRIRTCDFDKDKRYEVATGQDMSLEIVKVTH